MIQMDLKNVMKTAWAFFFVLTLLSGCATPVWVSKEPPVPITPVLSSEWGAAVGQVKQAIERDGNKWFKDATDQSPYALYASGDYLDTPAIFSYFFTLRSKKLYRVDITFEDRGVFEKAKKILVEAFRLPTYSDPEVNHWAWDDRSLLILQRDPAHVQISFSKGPFLLDNYRESGGSIGK